MLDWIPDLVTTSALSYLVILGFVWLDAWFPVVPGETLIIEDSLWLPLLISFATAGAIAGGAELLRRARRGRSRAGAQA